jgi:spore coat protein CotH
MDVDGWNTIQEDMTKTVTIENNTDIFVKSNMLVYFMKFVCDTVKEMSQYHTH